MILSLAFILFLLGSYVSYTTWFRESAWYLWTYIALNVACAVLWVLGTKHATLSEIYVFSLWWDTWMVVAYYMIPLVVLGVRLNTGTLVGSTLVVSGLIAIKMST